MVLPSLTCSTGSSLRGSVKINSREVLSCDEDELSWVKEGIQLRVIRVRKRLEKQVYEME